MPPNLALLLGVIFVLFAFRFDRKRYSESTGALFWPTLWYLVVASRPVGTWFGIWGIPLLGGSGSAEDGSPTDRYFYLALAVIGVSVLNRRRLDWGRFRRDNVWLITLLGFMLLSVVWSDYPYVSFKRFIKLLCSVSMALVVLTDANPLAAMTTVIRRCAYVHLPMSIITIKYFRNLGVSFDWSGTGVSWQGIATSKNTLGQVAMVASLYFLWELMRNWRTEGWKNLNFIYLMMGLYLLKGSDDAVSLTALSVFVFALVVFFRLNSFESAPWRIKPFATQVAVATFGLVALVIVHSVVMFSEESPFGWVITKFGRDITLTDRTVIWGQLYDVVARNPLLGVGFGGFWIGEQANIPFSHKMTWTLGQAHSGYVDTYLQVGWAGVFLLVGVILSSFPRILASFQHNFALGQFRLTFFLTILFVNITETSFLRGDHNLWFLFMVVLLNVPLPEEATEVQLDEAHNGTLSFSPTEPV